MISGNPTITGYVIATNVASASTTVTGPFTVSGNVAITYNGNAPGLPGGITVDLWQELIASSL